jgi:predicted Zn-dependent protease
VVSFSTGGVPELVRDGADGLVVEYKDTDALVSSLVGLAFSPDLRQQFGVSARERVCTSFDLKQISRQYEDLYMKVEEIEKGRHTAMDREIEIINKAMDSGNNRQAHDLLTRAIEQYPDSPDLSNLLVELDVRAGNLKGARETLLDLIRLWPTRHEFLSNLAILFWEDGDVESANKYFTDALRVSQFDRSIVLTYGEMLTGFGDFLKAKKLYEIYLKIDSSDLEIQTLFQETEKLSETA